MAYLESSNVVRKSRAFTLVELLVVIAVIGILSAVVVLNTNSAKAKARDAIRISDITSIQRALELYKTDKGSYPEECTTTGSCYLSYDADGAGKFIDTFTDYYPTGQIPNDPKNVWPYGYVYYNFPIGWVQPCDVNVYNGRIMLGVMTFESIASGTKHQSSPIKSSQSTCWPVGSSLDTWLSTLQWMYSVPIPK
jgi:prepilin-type N-terminal cleavage/methylation domain-containing protein